MITTKALILAFQSAKIDSNVILMAFYALKSQNKCLCYHRPLSTFFIRCWYPSPVRGLKKKRVKWKRAEGVEGPSPGAVFGGNGRPLMGTKGPYLLSGEILIPGLNRPLQSRAVNWATAGLLAGPLACWRAFPAAPRRQQPQAT